MATVPITRPSPDDPLPGDAPTNLPPDDTPADGRAGPQKAYPVDDPGLNDPVNRPGSSPDLIPGGPAGGLPSF